MIPDYYDEAALLERLTTGIQKSGQPVIFLVGSPITSAVPPRTEGVPNVGGVIDLIKQEFSDAQQIELEGQLSKSPVPYQAAFSFLLGRRGQHAANQIIKQAVWRARSNDSDNPFVPGASTPDEACRALDTDLDGWALSPAVAAIGELITRYPDQFGRSVLTTNFDPLISVAISKIRRPFFPHSTASRRESCADRRKRLPHYSPPRLLVRVRYFAHPSAAQPRTTKAQGIAQFVS
jgi:hypothetical protein